MAALLLLLASLLIAGGAVATAMLGMDDASLPYYSSNSEVMTYWQRVLPNSAMPSAIVEHLNTCAGNERVTFQQGFRKEREDEKVTFRWGSNTEVREEKVSFGLGAKMKGDDRRATFQWSQHSQDGEKATFGGVPSTNEPNKEINIQQENQIKGDDGKVTFHWGPHVEEEDRKTTLGWGLTKNGPNKETNFQRKIQMEGDDGRVTFHWGSIEKDDEKAALGWNLHHQGKNERISFGVGQQREHDDDHKVTFNWGSSHRKTDDEKTTLGWGSKTKSGDQKVTYQRRQNMDGGDIKKVIGPLGFHGSELLNDNHKVTFNWGSSHNEGNDEKVTSGWGPKTENDGHKVTYQWGPNMDGDIKKVVGPLGSHVSELSNNDDHKITSNWGSSHKEGNDEKVTFGWGSKIENDGHKVTYQWGPNMDEASDTLGTHPNWGDDKVTLAWRSNNQNIASLHDGSHQREEHHHEVHGTGHKHGHFNLANILFLEAVLTPGTLIAPYIEPSVSPTPFLSREIADSIPISTDNFTDILSMFPPMSHAMAGKIWSTLHTCEHPHTLEGEQQACATSIESMVELAASVLGTSDLQAFSSSPDVPVEGFVPSPASKYKVAAVRAVTSPGEKATTMTCHGMTFPYAVFYCHAVNPTRVYEVTLQMGVEEDGAAETIMQVIAVCHLDTSQFDPANPFFVARGLKPGDAAACHFLSRDSVLWAPAASTQGQGLVAAQ